MYQLILKNAHYYSQGAFADGDIYVKDGKIAAIAACGPNLGEAERVVDAQGLTVLPGIVDAHVHVREPGCEHREDFFTGSQAAAAGCVTTFCEMPLAVPPPYSVEVLENRIRLAGEKSLVDFAMYGAAGFENRHDLQSLVEAGVIGFKTFLHPAPAGREGEFKGLTVEDNGELFLMLREGARTDGRYFFHAEDAKLIAQVEKDLHARGIEDYSFHYKSRDNIAEVTSVATILELARETGCKVGLVHISTPEASELIHQAQAEGLDVIAETCFHYLTYDHRHIDKYGPYAKCNPPLRSEADLELLWEYVLDGTLSWVSSDHAPFSVAEKEIGVSEGIWKAYSGMPAVEMLLPIMLTHVQSGRISLEELAQLLSENVALQHGLWPQKGCIAVGSDADFAVIDLNRTYTTKIADMKTKAAAINKLFEGTEVTGKPTYTIVRGRVVMDHGEVDLEARGHGQYVARQG